MVEVWANGGWLFRGYTATEEEALRIGRGFGDQRRLWKHTELDLESQPANWTSRSRMSAARPFATASREELVATLNQLMSKLDIPRMSKRDLPQSIKQLRSLVRVLAMRAEEADARRDKGGHRTAGTRKQRRGPAASEAAEIRVRGAVPATSNAKNADKDRRRLIKKLRSLRKKLSLGPIPEPIPWPEVVLRTEIEILQAARKRHSKGS